MNQWEEKKTEESKKFLSKYSQRDNYKSILCVYVCFLLSKKQREKRVTDQTKIGNELCVEACSFFAIFHDFSYFSQFSNRISI